MIATPPAVRPLVKRPAIERRRRTSRRNPEMQPLLAVLGGLAVAVLAGGLAWLGVNTTGLLTGVVLFLGLALWLRSERRARLLAEREARTDALTGLLGRRGLDEALAAIVHAGRPVSALLLDLDHFKRINDSCGHLTGDQVLREVAAALRATLRSSDVTGRWGGEEFLVLLPDVDRLAAHAVAERLRAALSAQVAVQGEAVTASIGVASSLGQEQAHDLLARADAALYAAKRGGRNRTVVGGELEALARERCWN